MDDLDRNGLPYYRFTLDSIAEDGSDREAVESYFEGEVDRIDNGDTYDDILDRMEGPWEVDGVWRTLDLGTSTDDPVYRKLRRIAQQIRRELKA
jgi:hypothetical protein